MCTHILLKNDKANVITARTMDFSMEKDPEIYFIPRNHSIKFTRFKDLHSHHAFIGVGKKEDHYIFLDGMNEKGLSCSGLLFGKYADYSLEGLEDKINLVPGEFVKWILSNYGDVLELVRDIKNLNIVARNDRKSMSLHWVITDRQGNSIILEPKADSFKVYRNELGVLANSPNLSWQYVNLKRMTGIDIFEYKDKDRDREEVFVNSFGRDEMLDDYNSSESRFVRAVVSKASIARMETCEDLLEASRDIINKLKIPGHAKVADPYIEETKYSIYMCLDRLVVYYKFEDGDQVHRLDLGEMDLDSYNILKLNLDQVDC